MTDLPGSMSDFLSEFTHSLTQPNGDAVLRRINAERLLRLLADEFVEAHQAARIRILPDNRLVGEAGADFLMQIDDYDIRLQFVDAPRGVPEFELNQLPAVQNLLEDNPSTVALVLVWTTDDLKALELSMTRIRYVLGNPDRIDSLLQQTRPLPDVLRDLVNRQVKLWEIGLEEKPHTSVQSTDMRQMFERAIAEAIDAERQRSYRHTERKMAAQNFPADEEKRLMLFVLSEALNGVPSADLENRLTRLTRRGAK